MPWSSPITLATRITLLRIFAVPVFITLMVYYGQSVRQGSPLPVYRHAALALYIAVALTDFLDGYLARRRREVTELGKLLDPLADKALVTSGLVLLAMISPAGQPGHLPWWLIILVLSRDAFLVIGAGLIRAVTGQLTTRPSWTGKLATLLLLILVGGALAHFEGPVMAGLMVGSAVCVAVSWMQYLVHGLQQLAHNPQTLS